MPSLSLIVTSFNVAPWIDRALDSAAAVLRPGDELIVVDDASHDDSPARIRSFGATGQLAPDVAFRPILLGRNTSGGVGSAANIGLTSARCDIVAFLDGDDWIGAAGFEVARSRFAVTLEGNDPADLLVANYLEWHEAEERDRLPADAGRWQDVEALSGEAARHHALAMIAVPWRKLYRRSFLDSHKLRFPEGDFFFEDNPFHWAVLRAAGRILFCDRVICHHRIARPGQTMESRGTELLAFFTHYHSIVSTLDRREHALRLQAMRWLVNNMTWHMERLSPAAIAPWVAAAHDTLSSFPRRTWRNELRSKLEIWVAELLDLIRTGNLSTAEMRLLAMAATRQEAHLNRRLDGLGQEIAALRATLTSPGEVMAAEPLVALVTSFERLKAKAALSRAAPKPAEDS